jgi:hypothetical protein
MRKSRSLKKPSNLFKKIKKTTSKAVPIVKTGLKQVGTTVKNVAVKSAPIVNKGLEGVYGVLATSVDMGIKGIKHVSKGVSKKKRYHKAHRKRGGTTSRRY